MTPLVAVVGPTAVGKSALAVDLALAVDGEVVNADSMQLYVGMDIGTAKIAVPERLGVPHHLLDLWPVTRTASVAEYQERALAVVAAIRGRGRVPILVGGSGLYVHALVDRWDFPGTDPQIRAALEAELADLGPEALHERLARRDPEAAASIDPGNGRRLVRALEVGQLGGSFSARLPEITDDAGCGAPRSHAAAAGPRRSGRGPGRGDVGRRPGRRSAWPRRPGAPGRAHGIPRPRLRAGTPVPRRGDHRAAGAGDHRPGHPPVRSAPGVLVPQGPSHPVAAGRRCGPSRPGGRSGREAALECACGVDQVLQRARH